MLFNSALRLINLEDPTQPLISSVNNQFGRVHGGSSLNEAQDVLPFERRVTLLPGSLHFVEGLRRSIGSIRSFLRRTWMIYLCGMRCQNFLK